MKRLTIVACTLIAFVAGVAFLATLRRASRPPREAALTFIGITNLSAGNFAMFCLSNGTRARIACVPEAIEQSSAGTWRRTSLMGKGGSALLNWSGLREELKSGEAFTFMVPVPDSNGTWRLVFFCQEQAQLLDPATDLVRHVTDPSTRQTQLRQFSGRRYHSTSAEVVQ